MIYFHSQDHSIGADVNVTILQINWIAERLANLPTITQITAESGSQPGPSLAPDLHSSTPLHSTPPILLVTGSSSWWDGPNQKVCLTPHHHQKLPTNYREPGPALSQAAASQCLTRAPCFALRDADLIYRISNIWMKAEKHKQQTSGSCLHHQDSLPCFCSTIRCWFIVRTVEKFLKMN